MAWIIQSNSEGPVIIADIGLTFSAKQIRNVDLIGRHNAEQSNDLKLMIQKGFLKEIKKDVSEEGVDPQLIQKLNQTVQQATAIAQQATAASEAHAAKITVLEQQNTDLKVQNDEMEIQNEQMQTKMDKILKEVQAFSDKFPLEIKVFSEAMRNANTERKTIAEQREELPESGASEAEIKTQDKILALRDKKLEKNVQNIGKTVSQSSEDVSETLDALDKLGIG